jgi:hypothetical protein
MVEPVTAVLAVGKAIASPILTLIFREAGKHFSADEAKRLRRVLAEAVATPDRIPDSLAGKAVERGRKVGNRLTAGKLLGPPEDEQRVLDQLESVFAEASYVTGLAEGDDLRSWREKLELALAAVATKGLEDAAGSWKRVLDGQTERAWAERVAGKFETGLRRDSELHLLLARLDWGDEQAARLAVAKAAQTIPGALWRVAFFLGCIAAGITIGADELVALL